ncbi:MAG: NosD domain-containing protein, partial [Candidatus Thermoplasmatota archaeon]|nr:NosD domain-containing protein [Candidatus Thermoplasmatota archaeon]
MVILVPIMFSFLALGDEERNVNFLHRFHSKTIIVDATGSGDYISLIDAVKNADSGDVIRVYDGFYEGEIKIGSSISIIGNGSQTIIGGKYGYFEIRSDNVTISNLTITDHIDEKVRVCWGEHVKLDTLIIQSGKLGISLHENCNVLISNCTFSNISNNHISYYKSKEVNLLNNTFIDGPKVSMNISGRKIVLNGNKFINNSLGFDFNSIEDFDSIHIDETNRRNNNPLVFLKREENRIINCENNTQYFFINCNNITFRSGKIKNVHNPLLIYNSSFLSLSQLDIENSSDIFCSKSNNIYFDNMKFYKSGMLINKTYGMWVNNSIVNINGFMIEDSGYISIMKSHFLNITISNYFNYVSLSALYTLSSNNISIQDNKFRDNIQSIRKGDNAQSNGIIINNNTFENCNVSVALDRVKETIISNNMIISSEYGLEYYDCEESSIFNNIFNQQGNKFYSVTISMSDKIKIYNNTIRTSMIGLKITGSNQCDVYNNTLSNNVHGLNIFYSKEGNIYNNKIINNNYGAELVNSNDIKIWKNIFIDNLNQASDNTNANKWYNSYPIGGNYWSDYHGEDKKKGVHQSESGSDGFGDLPKSLISTSDRYPIFIDTIKPTANAKGDKIVDEGSVIHFQSASTDDQMVMETIWKFVYDGVNIIISYPEFDFIFHIPGTYKILLTVFDFAGNNDTDDIIITVKDINVPISKSQGNIIKNQGSILYFNGSLSYDTGGIAMYEWLFDYYGTSHVLEGVNVSFFFDRPGRIPVTLRVTDNAGHVGESIFNVTIVDLTDPIADAG